jgi:hypothetical protein
MRAKLVVTFLSCCTAYLFAGQLPLTVEEISLMLRSGYSSDTIIRDLSTRHFGDRLDPEAEKELVRAKASSALLDALKSGKYAASEDEIKRARERVAEANESARKYAEQQMIAARHAAARTRARLVELQKLNSERQAREAIARKRIAAEEAAEAQAAAEQAAGREVAQRRQPIPPLFESTRTFGQLGPVAPNAYGLGINADEFGRPHTYRTQGGEKLSPIFQEGVRRDAYGLGVHADEFGRPVYDGKP